MREHPFLFFPRHLALLLIQTGLLLAHAACAAETSLTWPLIEQAIRLRYPTVAQLPTDSLAAWLARAGTTRPLILDVRAPEEYQVSHLRDARLTPDLDSALKLLKTAPADTPIVAYCSVGYRSSELAEKLRKAGYTRVFNLEGSIFAWANEGHPVYRDTVEVEEVHPYGKPWTRLLNPEYRPKTE